MALMEWDESMSVGVEELDEQHRTLIDLINEAYEAIQKHDGQKVSTIVDRMREYAALHFVTEERLMEEVGYPDLELHKSQHTKFVNDVDKFRQEQTEKANLSKIFIYLSRWLTLHIMDEDKKYTEHMPSDRLSAES